MLFRACIRFLIIAFLLFPASHGAWATGEDWLAKPQVVVELYTSQGCSSCPPADKLIAGMVGCGQILPLGFHVDYWDYLGWKDAFASGTYTARQRLYARSFRKATIYTPQIIVQGKDYTVGSYAGEVRQAIRKAGRDLPNQTIRLDLEGQRLSGDGLHNDLALTVVTFDPALHNIDIQSGENRNRTIAYANVVTGLRKFDLGPVRNGSIAVPTEAAEFLAGTDESIAILVHERDGMRIQTALVKHKHPLNERTCQDNLGLF